MIINCNNWFFDAQGVEKFLSSPRLESCVRILNDLFALAIDFTTSLNRLRGCRWNLL